MIIAGIMTGTSLDGIDVAICNVKDEGGRQTVTLLSFYEAPYPADIRYLVQRAIDGKASMEDLSDIPFLLARAFSEVFEAAKDEIGDPGVVAIAVHGQTLWHHPPYSTWQTVSGPALATLSDTPVIHDFRAADIAVGGQGAPLVPIYDHIAIRDKEIDRIALNIGGMANLSIATSNKP